MSELHLGPRIYAILVAVGLMTGLVGGVMLARVLWPAPMTGLDVSDLTTKSQDDYIALTAATFALDKDLDRAKGRLSLLKDAKILDRMATLAKLLAAKKSADATYIASLAAAMGSTDSTVLALAVTATPTPSPTAPPTPTAMPTIAATDTVQPTSRATKSGTPTKAPTRRPSATPPPKAPPVAAPVWIPSFPGEWPGGAHYEPAVNVAPGQKFWHLARAQYCDDRDTRNNCPNLPGGDTGTNIYISLIDAGGNRISGSLIVKKDANTQATVDDLGPEKSASDLCSCNYSYLANQWPIQVAGYPSDTMSGLGLYSVRMRLPQAHTRYYLTFQLLTR